MTSGEVSAILKLLQRVGETLSDMIEQESNMHLATTILILQHISKISNYFNVTPVGKANGGGYPCGQ